MPRRSRTLATLLAVALGAAIAPLPITGVAAAATGGAVDARNLGNAPMDRVVVQWRGGPDQVQPGQQIDRLTNAVPGLRKAADVGNNATAYWVPPANSRAAAMADLKTIAAVAGVVEVAPDVRVMADLVPDDPYYASDQSDLFGTWGIDAQTAWDTTTGAASVTVAVIDTGITTHSEFTGRVLPGYDFISDVQVANDGDGRDADPADPGDWVTHQESASGYFAGCPATDSTWHGTHVAGTIGARGNNGVGVAGIAWETSILPVRVLGKCGGYLSDITAAIRWSAGGTVPGVPDNPNPARVLSLSLGGPGACDSTTQSAIDEAIGNGAVVVVAAGNDNADLSGHTPASCSGVIAVTATTSAGTRASFSNYGAGATVAAPGVSIVSTWNDGTRSPGSETYAWASGTSMATPHVSGVAALALAVDPTLTSAALRSLIVDNVSDFAPDGSADGCQALGCGTGIVDAAAVVAAAEAGITPTNTAPVATPDSYATAGAAELDVAAPGVLGNDTDAETDPLAAVLESDVSHGTLVLASDGGFSYAPTGGYSGPDSFTYHATDGIADSNVVTVSLTVDKALLQGTVTVRASGTPSRVPRCPPGMPPAARGRGLGDRG